MGKTRRLFYDDFHEMFNKYKILITITITINLVLCSVLEHSTESV